MYCIKLRNYVSNLFEFIYLDQILSHKSRMITRSPLASSASIVSACTNTFSPLPQQGYHSEWQSFKMSYNEHSVKICPFTQITGYRASSEKLDLVAFGKTKLSRNMIEQAQTSWRYS